MRIKILDEEKMRRKEERRQGKRKGQVQTKISKDREADGKIDRESSFMHTYMIGSYMPGGESKVRPGY